MAGLMMSFLKNGLSPMTPDLLITLFNNKLAGVGRIKKAPGFFLPATLVQDFLIMRDQHKFNTPEIWEEYFDAVKASYFLTKEFTPSLIWLLKPENAFKVLSGQYDNKEQGLEPKTAKNVNSEAQIMANKFFNKIIKAGSHGLMNEIKNLNPIETRALELFGRASEILQCSDNQVVDLKIRLRSAFVQAIQES